MLSGEMAMPSACSDPAAEPVVGVVGTQALALVHEAQPARAVVVRGDRHGARRCPREPPRPPAETLAQQDALGLGQLRDEGARRGLHRLSAEPVLGQAGIEVLLGADSSSSWASVISSPIESLRRNELARVQSIR